MKWRCEWCHKPHEADDPPCDACGHGQFERAVVPERETVDTGTQYVWVCPNCGREHVRNTPPCSRCGEPNLEQVELEARYEDVEADLEAPGYLEVAKPYLPILLLLVVGALLLASGVVSPSILPGIGNPSPPDAPGTADAAAGIDLGEVERLTAERLAETREDGRRYDEGLAAVAAYRNAQLVDARYGGDDPGELPIEEFDLPCDGQVVGAPVESLDASIDDYGSEDDLAADLADALTARFDAAAAGHDAEGLDVRVGPDPDRELFVFYAAC